MPAPSQQQLTHVLITNKLALCGEPVTRKTWRITPENVKPFQMAGLGPTLCAACVAELDKRRAAK
jgi:hypothetical protein